MRSLVAMIALTGACGTDRPEPLRPGPCSSTLDPEPVDGAVRCEYEYDADGHLVSLVYRSANSLGEIVDAEIEWRYEGTTLVAIDVRYDGDDDFFEVVTAEWTFGEDEVAQREVVVDEDGDEVRATERSLDLEGFTFDRPPLECRPTMTSIETLTHASVIEQDELISDVSYSYEGTVASGERVQTAVDAVSDLDSVRVFRYGGDGLLVSVESSTEESIEIERDPDGRIVRWQETTPDGGFEIVYEYDEAGNLTSSGAADGGFAQAYDYDCW